jgi:hypothetical protein
MWLLSGCSVSELFPTALAGRSSVFGQFVITSCFVLCFLCSNACLAKCKLDVIAPPDQAWKFRRGRLLSWSPFLCSISSLSNRDCLLFSALAEVSTSFLKWYMDVGIMSFPSRRDFSSECVEVAFCSFRLWRLGFRGLKRLPRLSGSLGFNARIKTCVF